MRKLNWNERNTKVIRDLTVEDVARFIVAVIILGIVAVIGVAMLTAPTYF